MEEARVELPQTIQKAHETQLSAPEAPIYASDWHSVCCYEQASSSLFLFMYSEELFTVLYTLDTSCFWLVES